MIVIAWKVAQTLIITCIIVHIFAKIDYRASRAIEADFGGKIKHSKYGFQFMTLAINNFVIRLKCVKIASCTFNMHRIYAYLGRENKRFLTVTLNW